LLYEPAPINRIWGLTLHYRGNAMRRLPTVAQNLRGSVVPLGAEALVAVLRPEPALVAVRTPPQTGLRLVSS
jgi:hypothetical protein